MRILLVEDEPDLARLICRGLREDDYAVDHADNGEDGLWRATTIDYDAVVLDLGLPKLDGTEILRRMRRGGRTAPVMVLTARDGIDDRVHGLDLGADDYLVKPFAWDEFVARVRALVRRSGASSAPVLTGAGIELDPMSRAVRRDGEPVELTSKEFQVLHLLMSRPSRVFTRSEIMEHIYDDDHDAGSNVVDVFLSRLRRKFRARGGRDVLRTVRGVGYAFDA